MHYSVYCYLFMIICLRATIASYETQCFHGSGRMILMYESYNEQQKAHEVSHISHPLICNATMISCPKIQPDLIWISVESKSQYQFLNQDQKEQLSCVRSYGVKFYILEYRERCFRGFGCHTMKISVNTSYDALSKINTAMSAITDPKIGNATEVTCPGLTYWRTILSGDVTDIYIAGNEAMNPNQADKDLLKRIRPYLYNNFSVNLSNLPWWAIFLIVLGCIACLGLCFMCYVKWDDIRGNWRSTTRRIVDD